MTDELVEHWPPISAYATERVYSPKGREMVLAHRDGTTDLSTIGATFTLWGRTADEYKLRDHESMSGWAIDVGAHCGAVTLALAADHPDLRVIAIEPLAENVDVIRRSVEISGLTNVEIVHAAATDRVRKRVSVEYGWSEAEGLRDDYVVNSRFVGGMLHDASGTTAEVPGVSLGSIIKTYAIDRVRFLKIDCEGCEWQFLRSPHMDRVDEIIGEYHHEGAPGAIRDLISATHEVSVEPAGVTGLFHGFRR